jgi:hypothetical protein
MRLTTPAQERYTRVSCPNPACRLCNQPHADHVVHRSWTGKHKHIERLRGTICGCEFSERQGTLMARSKLPEATVAQLLQCHRWGVCDAGTADICAVELQTLHRLQRVAAQRAATHHWQRVQAVDVRGGQLEEAHAQLRPTQQVEGVHTALAMGSWLLLWIDFGPRTQETAATLIAQVVPADVGKWAAAATGARSGSWSVSPTLCCPIKACDKAARRVRQRWPLAGPTMCGAIESISGSRCMPTQP